MPWGVLFVQKTPTKAAVTRRLSGCGRFAQGGAEHLFGARHHVGNGGGSKADGGSNLGIGFAINAAEEHLPIVGRKSHHGAHEALIAEGVEGAGRTCILGRVAEGLKGGFVGGEGAVVEIEFRLPGSGATGTEAREAVEAGSR